MHEDWINYKKLKKNSFIVLTALFMFTMLLIVSVSAQTVDGDLNGDGKIDVSDAIIISKHVLGLEILTDEQLNVADINSDGVVDVRDLVLVMKKAMEFEFSANFIVSAAEIDVIYVPYGTSQEDIDFPKRVLVVLNDGREIYTIVAWDDFSTPSYDPLTAGNFVFRGSLVKLPGGLKNPDSVFPRVNVVVFIPSAHEPEEPIATQ